MTTAALPPAAGRRLVFLHVAKTGGTTLDHHFAKAFAPDEICPRNIDLHQLPPDDLARYRYFSGHFVYDQLRLIPGPIFTVTVLRNPAERVISNYYFLKRHTPQHLASHPIPAADIARRCPDLLTFLRRPELEIRFLIENTMARQLAGIVHVVEGGGYVYRAAGRGIPMSELEIMHRATGALLAIDVVGFTHDLASVYARVALAFGMPQQIELARLNTRSETSASLEPVADEPVTEEARRELSRLTNLDRSLYQLARAHVAMRR
ncbi:sulfotransferase family protein [Neoroseomonas lacus]|uniref:Sulfotransferase family protein n=1 Tax=Neoroseomonas lacus TaxID=287609 RepID=A0A917KBL0_9PROT|nr:sulfotransferase family 2 domain-containing protein [Neoroseomonas lacus]GGJ08167.1 hypothetical protein GCM10011320_13950 [Neoroseomonas lacus]